jgi:16S rRNA (adenine1518-N6/adenine1519-N6)-dimethyltransferase
LGNLPYYVASQLLLKFIEYPNPISLFLFMLQKEMARRISAQPATNEYGAMTLFVQAYYRVTYLRSVPATVFLPQPEVDSAFIELRPRRPSELPAFHEKTFRQLVTRGFSQRRKQLQKLLREQLPDWPAAATELGINLTARAEELSLEQWIALSNLVYSPGGKKAAAEVAERFPVVDENDRQVSEAPRAEVHGNNLRHRAVHIFVLNAADEVFLQKRSRWKDRHPSLWDSSAAGHVDAGEEYDAAANRELEEELGISAELTRMSKLPASEETGQEFIWLYRAKHEGPFDLAPIEIDYGAFFPLPLISKWIAARPQEFAPGFVACWNVYNNLSSPARDVAAGCT